MRHKSPASREARPSSLLKGKKRILAVVAALGVLSTVALTAVNAADSDPKDQLLVSSSRDHSKPASLTGATLAATGNAYVFVVPSAKVKAVEFYLNDASMTRAPMQIERITPYDLAGTESDMTGRPLALSKLAKGKNVVTAKMVWEKGSPTTLTANFSVGSAATAPTTAPAPAPKPTTTATRAPTPTPTKAPTTAPAPAPTTKPTVPTTGLFPLKAGGPDKRNLVTASGEPFLYLADTPWLTVSKLKQDEIKHLMDTRKSQGFNTLQMMLLPMPSQSSKMSNAYGDEPLVGRDLTKPREVGGRTTNPSDSAYDYWDHVDWTFDQAAARGMNLTVAPAWYGYAGEDWRTAVTNSSAPVYGAWVAKRLGHKKNLLWIMGGDNNPDTTEVYKSSDKSDKTEATNRMANAIRANESVRHLMSYHAKRRVSSGRYFAGQPWHTVHFAYSNEDIPRYVTPEYKRGGMPVIVPEAVYDHRVGQMIGDRALRAQTYQAYLLGAAGYAYGSWDVWPITSKWRSSIQANSAQDMKRAGAFFRSYRFDQLRPTSGLLRGGAAGTSEVVAAQAMDKSFAMAYYPKSRSDVEVNLGTLGGSQVTLSWFDPAKGTTKEIGTYAASGSKKLSWPSGQSDAVLVVKRR